MTFLQVTVYWVNVSLHNKLQNDHVHFTLFQSKYCTLNYYCIHSARFLNRCYRFNGAKPITPPANLRRCGRNRFWPITMRALSIDLKNQNGIIFTYGINASEIEPQTHECQQNCQTISEKGWQLIQKQVRFDCTRLPGIISSTNEKRKSWALPYVDPLLKRQNTTRNLVQTF